VNGVATDLWQAAGPQAPLQQRQRPRRALVPHALGGLLQGVKDALAVAGLVGRLAPPAGGDLQRRQPARVDPLEQPTHGIPMGIARATGGRFARLAVGHRPQRHGALRHIHPLAAGAHDGG
jgi:hypothetical protein